jgi:succinate dehydrogenase/fumarate reductase-like Fe-S protein
VSDQIFESLLSEQILQLFARAAERGIEHQCCLARSACVEVCPKEIPLVDSITQVSRQATTHMLFGWLFS